jgi:hypothetical protein
MRNRTVKTVLAFLLALGVVAAVALKVRRAPQTSYSVRETESEGNLPPALRAHLETLKWAIPGNGGESREGPGAADAEHFLALAYPDVDIPIHRLRESRKSFDRIKGKGFPRGKRRGQAWESVGPTQALYPFFEFRDSSLYVPNEYVAGGRATAVAIDPDCRSGHGDDDDWRGHKDKAQDGNSDRDWERDWNRHGHKGRGDCRLWIFAAGGGVWRTKNALSRKPEWEFISSSFAMNSGSSLALDPNDDDADTIYAGTGEANASADSAAGVGLYRSRNGGDSWIGPLGASAFNGRAIGSIEVVPGSPNTIYVATTRGVLGVSSVSGGAASLIPGAPAWGLYKSTDSGQTWTFLHNGAPTAAACDTVEEAVAGGSPCSLRGVRRVVLDPFDPEIVYASSYGRGVWRSTDGGATWVQINPSLNSADANMRPEIAVNTLASAKTRMYVYEGSTGNPSARLFRSDDVASGAPVFTNLTSSNPADPGYGTFNLCTGQCWYDNMVYTPAGYPDIVYVGGSYSYGQTFSNKRGLVLSTDAGVSATDMTMDGTDPVHPNALHPDQHALVTHPDNPYLFFEVNDGGLMRSSGEFTDVSAWCDDRGLDPAGPLLGRCRQLLSRVPTKLTGMNDGMQTLQFQSLSVSPFDSRLLQGGTQDNGTWQSTSSRARWNNTMIGDGGQSGFDAVDPHFRFHTFFNATPDVNFSDGDIADWNWIGDPLGTEPQAFYVPIIADPKVSKTLFVGTGHVWRTKTWGMGSMTLDEFREQCNEWTGQFTVVCGDWQPLGDPATPGRLTSASYGDRAGGFVVAVERASRDTSTLWAATQTGRVFITKNADADPASAVIFTRLDSLAANDPNRFVSGIHIDPADANHAWISYSGFNAATPSTPGHVFEVTYDPGLGTATWADLSFDLGEVPITDVARDDKTGDLYASSDAAVYRLECDDDDWTHAGTGMPRVEVAGLTILPSSRKLYAATHGMGAWLLRLP